MGTSGSLEDLDLNWSRTEFSCRVCGESISFAEEVFVITIAVAQLGVRGMQYSPLLFAEDGDFLYEPVFLCANCWEDSQEGLGDIVRDIPSVLDDYAVVDCGPCKSGIREGEVVALVTYGEIRLSKRCPNGINGGSTFEVMDADPTILCISCINTLSKEVVDELWTELVKQFNECPEGTEIRCWRNGCSADEDSDCANCKRQAG